MNFSTNLAAAKLPIKLPIKLKNDAERVFCLFVCFLSYLAHLFSLFPRLKFLNLPSSPEIASWPPYRSLKHPSSKHLALT